MPDRSRFAKPHPAGNALRTAAAVAVAAVLWSCAGVRTGPSGALSVTVKPGETGTCAISPCEILLEMPPGDGEYLVRGRGFDYGRYPAGKTVSLGNFYEPQSIEIIGAGVPKAYVYLPVDL
jgi:hypothetical protein